MNTCTDYSSTLDCFSYIWGCAPDFSINTNATLDSVFSDIDDGVAAIASRTQNPEALRLLEECRDELRTTLQLYKDGKDIEAQKLVFHAKQIFVKAGKLKKSKAPQAERVEEDYQD